MAINWEHLSEQHWAAVSNYNMQITTTLIDGIVALFGERQVVIKNVNAERNSMLYKKIDDFGFPYKLLEHDEYYADIVVLIANKTDDIIDASIDSLPELIFVCATNLSLEEFENTTQGLDYRQMLAGSKARLVIVALPNEKELTVAFNTSEYDYDIFGKKLNRIFQGEV